MLMQCSHLEKLVFHDSYLCIDLRTQIYRFAGFRRCENISEQMNKLLIFITKYSLFVYLRFLELSLVYIDSNTIVFIEKCVYLRTLKVKSYILDTLFFGCLPACLESLAVTSSIKVPNLAIPSIILKFNHKTQDIF